MAQPIFNDSSQDKNGLQTTVDLQQQQQFLRSKKRADNYSRKDKEKLIELVTSRLDIVENKVANTGINLQKAHCWVEIANEYNEGRNPTSDFWRDDRQLKDLWKRMKFTARADLIRSARRKDKDRNDDSKDGVSNGVAQSHEILDDFTLILLRLVPAHFQIDTDGKVLQVIDELLALSPDEVENQKVLSRTLRQERRQQMTGHYSNQDDDDDDDDACVLLEMNSGVDNSPNIEPFVILPPPQCPTNRSSASGTPVMSNSPQMIDMNRSMENSQLQISSLPYLPPMSSASSMLQQQPPPPLLEQQQQNVMFSTEPIVNIKTENVVEDTVMNDNATQNWYIEQIRSRNEYENVVNEPVQADPGKEYQFNRRKRKNPFYRTLLEDDQNEIVRQQLIEMARKENEKELQLLDVQTQCEKQRLVREKMETENAVLKQRLLLQMLQSQINTDKGMPSISLLL